MSNLKTDEDDDFITSASPETEPDEADFAFDAKEKKKKHSAGDTGNPDCACAGSSDHFYRF